MLRKATKRRLWQNWGYILLAAMLLVFIYTEPSVTATITVAVLSVFDLGFFFFYARMPCGVKNRGEGFCRNRGYGFLIGCSHVEAHRWMKIAALFKRATYSVSIRTILGKLNGKAAAIGSAATVIIALMAILTFTFGAPGPR